MCVRTAAPSGGTSGATAGTCGATSAGTGVTPTAMDGGASG
jgi:hypothetical protein